MYTDAPNSSTSTQTYLIKFKTSGGTAYVYKDQHMILHGDSTVMASELHVDAIKHSGGTSAMTIDSSGNVSIPGSVVQMQSTTIDTSISQHISTTLVASGLIVAITPKFSTSKILVNLTGGNLNWSGGENSQHVHIYRQLTGRSYSSYLHWKSR